MTYIFHSLHFQVIKRAATFALLGDVDFKRNGDMVHLKYNIYKQLTVPHNQKSVLVYLRVILRLINWHW